MLSLERVIVKPPFGAADEIVTVPVEAPPPTTVFGENDSLTRVGAATARVAVLEDDPSEPVISAVTFEATAVVDTVNVAVVCPEATVTEVGTVMPLAVLLLDRVTVVPAVGAGVVNVTVPVELAPPTSDVGLNDTLASVGTVALTVSVAVFTTELRVAVIVAVAGLGMETVLTVKAPAV